MKNIAFIILPILFSVAAIAEEKETNLSAIDELNIILDKQRKEYSKCPRIKTIHSAADLSRQESDYFDYAKNTMIYEFNAHINQYEFEDFFSRISLLVRKDGTVEKIEILTVEPITQKIELEKLVKHGLLKLKEIPVQEECTKYNILFRIDFRGTNSLKPSNIYAK